MLTHLLPGCMQCRKIEMALQWHAHGLDNWLSVAFESRGLAQLKLISGSEQ
jgi:hypothetical protein